MQIIGFIKLYRIERERTFFKILFFPEIVLPKCFLLGMQVLSCDYIFWQTSPLPLSTIIAFR